MSAHPPVRLRSRKPLFLDLTASDIKTRWQEVRDLSIVSNKALVSDPTVWQLGFELHRHTWSLLNRFHTNTGLCGANLHKWCLTSSNKCQCGERQTMIHIVELCHRTKFTDKGLILSHEADDNAVK